MLEVLVVNVIVLKVMFFNQHILANSQLTNMQWPCYCTVHLVMSFIFVIRYGLLTGSEYVLVANACLYLYMFWESTYLDEMIYIQ